MSKKHPSLKKPGVKASVWLQPLVVPLAVSAALHVAVLVTFVSMDLRFGSDGPIAAHNADEVSTSIELAPRPAPEPTPAAPPAPAAEPEQAKAQPEPEAIKTPEPAVAREPEAFDAPVTKLIPPSPVVERPQQPAPPKAPEPEAARPEPVAKQAAPSAGFAGVKVQQAGRIVYAVDVSGAMAACLDSVLTELRRSIGRLEPGQQFQIVFFRQELNGSQRAVAIDDQGGKATMMNATETNKRRVDQLLRSARPLGRSAPLAGLKRSLDLAPDVVFLLTSNIRRSDQGAGSDAEVLKALDDLNPRSRISGRRPVVIKTLQFVEDDPTGLMQSIAAEHGDGAGSYVLLKVADIERAR